MTPLMEAGAFQLQKIPCLSHESLFKRWEFYPQFSGCLKIDATQSRNVPAKSLVSYSDGGPAGGSCCPAWLGEVKRVDAIEE